MLGSQRSSSKVLEMQPFDVPDNAAELDCISNEKSPTWLDEMANLNQGDDTTQYLAYDINQTPSIAEHLENSSDIVWQDTIQELSPSLCSSPIIGARLINFNLSLGTPIIPRHDHTCAAEFYANTWKQHCLPALHPSFRCFGKVTTSARLIADVQIAISACRLSRVLPHRKLFISSAASPLQFRPDMDHETLGQEYYGSAMRRMALWSTRDFESEPTLGLAVLIFFCYLESSMGHFREFQLHSRGVDKMIETYAKQSIRYAAELYAAYVEIKMLDWWRRVHFATPDFCISQSPLTTSSDMEPILNMGNNRRSSILVILCESQRIKLESIVRRWDDRVVMELQVQDVSSVDDIDPRSEPLNSLDDLIKAQHQKADEWLARLDVPDLPTGSWQVFSSKAGSSLDSSLDIQPLRFTSHRAAMNFAYFVASRVIQCGQPPENPDQDTSTDASNDVESWVLILLRIAAGIDWETCVQTNVYTVGLVSLFLACLLCSRSLAIGLWMETWLHEQQQQKSGFEEGCFPVFQVLGGLRLINAERQKGRDVIALFQSTNDGGGSGKFGSYHSQTITSFLVYGRCRVTGELFSKHAEFLPSNLEHDNLSGLQLGLA